MFIIFFTIYGCTENDLTDILLYETEGNPVVHTTVPDNVLNVMHRQIEFDFRNTYFSLQNTGAIEKWKAPFGEEPIEVSIQKQQAVQTAYYNRYIDAEGIAIVGNAAVEEKHFINARRILLLMTAKHPDLRKFMQTTYRTSFAEYGFYFILYNDGPVRYSPVTGEPFPVDQNKGLSQVPEFYLQFLLKTGFYGWGEIGTCYMTQNVPNYTEVSYICIAHTRRVGYVTTSGNEYTHLSVFTHEAAHKLERVIRVSFDPDFSDKINHAFKVAVEKGAWKGLSSETPPEYWAYGTELWFYEIGKGRKFETYEDFKKFDPLLYDLLSEWYPKISLQGY